MSYKYYSACSLVALCLLILTTSAFSQITTQPNPNIDIFTEEYIHSLVHGTTDYTGDYGRIIVNFAETDPDGVLVPDEVSASTHYETTFNAINELLESVDRQLGLYPLFYGVEEEILHLREQAERNTGVDFPRLEFFYQIPLTIVDLNPRQLKDLVLQLNDMDSIVVAFVEPKVQIPDVILEQVELFPDLDDIIYLPPNFEPLQFHLGPPPAGMNIKTAWKFAGGRGEGIQFIDIEASIKPHDDLPALDDFFHLANNVPKVYYEHGINVMGLIAAKDNGWGTIGIAHQADVGFQSIMTADINYNEALFNSENVAVAFIEAAMELQAGDVILLELQRPTDLENYEEYCNCYTNCRSAPVEYWPPMYQVIKTAIAGLGIIVVEAAGNGGNNLDSPFYGGAFDPGDHNSWAILISGSNKEGLPPAGSYCVNYGKRIDLRGISKEVVTTGARQYGNDLYKGPNIPYEKSYTEFFSGTSSASALVAGAVVSLQGVVQANKGYRLEPLEMRDLLKATGTEQLPGENGEHVGRYPNLEKAIKQLSIEN